MSNLEVRLLGSPVIQVNRDSIPVTQRKALALMAFLSMHPGPHARESLAALLWPDSTLAVSRAALRNALSHLRHLLGPCADRLSTDRTAVEVCLGPHDVLDIHQLGAGVTEVWRGPFLEGLEGGLSDAFEAWVTRQREVLTSVADRAFDVATRGLLVSSPLLAVQESRRWLTLDRLNEAAWRRLIQALLAIGHRPQARAAFEACRATLLEEVGLPPAPETLAFEERLTEREVPSAGQAPVPQTPVFVGRADEFARLTAVCALAQPGLPQTAVISGEPGIGKTRLARRLTEWAAGEGARVLRGRAFEAHPQALGIWVDLLRRALREGGSTLHLADTWERALALLLPELGPVEAASYDVQGEGLLLEAVTQACLGLASGQAQLLMLLDDLQWADEASLTLLQYVAQRFADEKMRLVLVLTVREEAVALNTAVAASLTRLGRETVMLRMALGPLSAADTHALVAAMDHQAEVGAVADWLYRHSQGHPLYLTEALKDLTERHAIDQTGPRWQLRAERLTGVLPGVRAVIEERLGRLPAAALAVAQACTVLGEHAGFTALCQVADLTEEDALTGCEVLLQTGLLRERFLQGDQVYRFSHDRVRETVEAQLSSVRLRLLHRRALQAFQTGADPGLLAHHAMGSGMRPEARHYLRLSAAEADRLGFAGAAQTALSTALELGVEGAERAELLLLYAETCERLGDEAGEQQAGAEALTLARRLNVPALSVKALNRLAWVAQSRQQPEDWRHLSEEALGIARTLNEPMLLVSSLQGFSRSYRQDDPQRAYTLQREAMELLSLAGQPKRLGHGYLNMAYTHLALGDTGAAVECRRLAAEDFLTSGHDYLYALALGELGISLIELGQGQEAAAVLERATTVREQSLPCAPVFRAAWACALALKGEALLGWTVLRQGVAGPIGHVPLIRTLLWAAHFLDLCDSWKQAATLLGLITTTPADPDDNQLRFVLKHLQMGRPAIEFTEALEAGHRLTLEEGLGLLRLSSVAVQFRGAG